MRFFFAVPWTAIKSYTRKCRDELRRPISHSIHALFLFTQLDKKKKNAQRLNNNANRALPRAYFLCVHALKSQGKGYQRKQGTVVCVLLVPRFSFPPLFVLGVR